MRGSRSMRYNHLQYANPLLGLYRFFIKDQITCNEVRHQGQQNHACAVEVQHQTLQSKLTKTSQKI